MADNSAIMLLRARLADLRGRGIYQGWPNDNRAIFIHIPKTAGSSIAQGLLGGPRGNPHAPYHEYERVNPRKFRRFFKFTFIRNPWDRLVSSYFYLRHGTEDSGQQAWYAREIAPHGDFAGFVRGWLNDANARSSLHFKPQHYFICDADLRLRVDFVGRVETIERDFEYVCRRLGMRGALDWTNKSDHRPYTEYYTDELRERVAAVYADDIALFGYRFDARHGRAAASCEQA